MKFLESPCQSLRYHVSLRCLHHAEGAARVNNQDLRHILVKQQLLRLFLRLEFEVSIVCEGVASDRRRLLFTFNLLQNFLGEEAVLHGDVRGLIVA